MLKVFAQKKSAAIPFVYQCLVSLPSDYHNDHSERKWPLLLFLHGAGECHPPIEKILKNGPPKLVHAYSTNKQDKNLMDDSDFKAAQFLSENFVTCSPQVNEGYGWNIPVLVDLLDQIEQNYRIDQNKIYCTGISMGGYGTWSLAMAQPNRFAAIIPICGGGDVTKVSSLKHLPIWNFHGKLDEIIPFEESIQLINTLNSPLCKSTIYPNLKHDSWTETYNNKDIYIWLLQQTKSN